LAPVGNGFRLEASTRRLLLAGEEPSLAPLLALAYEAVQKQIAVTLLIQQGRDAPLGRLAEALLPVEVEYQVAPQLDVSAELLGWCDQAFVAGPRSAYVHLKARISESPVVHASDFAQAVGAPTMPCGFGVCLGCVVETTRGL